MRWVMLALLMVSVAAPPAYSTLVTEVHYVMGTYFRITADASDVVRARRAMRECFGLTRRLEEQFSRFDPTSELSRLNATAGSAERVVISPEMRALLERALVLRKMTGGTFDVGIGALTRLWRTSAIWPDDRAIRAVQERDETTAFALEGSVLIRRPGVLIDVDGIAKGWAVDRCVGELRADGIRRALLNFGESSLYAMGAPAGTRGWPVAVRGLDDDTLIGRLTLRDDAVSVSSVFGHARYIGARQVAHIIDPRSGLPLRAPAAAVVVGPSATDAEAFSKALLIEPHAVKRVADGVISGTLRITRHGIKRTGAVPFTGFPRPRHLGPTAEALQ